MGAKNRKFFFCFYWFKNGFWSVLSMFWRLFFSRSAKPTHGSMYKVWGEKIENFFFVSYALKTIFKGFRMCFEDFWFSRSAIPLHEQCIRYGWKNWKFFFCFIWFKNDFNGVLDMFWRLLFFEVAKSVTWLMYKVWVKKIKN